MGAFFLGSFLLLWLSVLFVQKSKKQENLIVWIVISFMLSLCIQAFTSGIIGLIGIKITLLSVALFNYLVTAGLTWCIFKKGIQYYRFCFLDLIAIFIIIFLTWRFALHRYGPSIEINFVSVDAATHSKFAREVALEHRLPVNMFFSALPTGLMMSAWSSLTGMEPGEYYKVFICCEMVYLALSALLFWATIRESCGEGWLRCIVPLFSAPLYWIGYPAYSTIFGFSYFGMSICIITLLVFFLKRWFYDNGHCFWNVIGLNLSLFSIFVCYTLFVPVVFFGTFVTLSVDAIKRDRKKLVNKKNIMTFLSVFLIPTILGMLYSFDNLEALNAPPGNAGITTDGGCYTDLYSNFIPLIPFALIGIYYLLNKKTWTYILPVTAIQCILTGIFFIGVWNGKVSVYYYMRNNNLIWLLIWILTTEGILGMSDHCKAAVLFPLLFYGLLYVEIIGNEWIEQKNSRLEIADSSVFSIVHFDMDFYYSDYYKVSKENRELYDYINSNCSADERVVCLGPDIATVWFQTCTGHNEIMIYGNLESFLEMKGDAKYICAMYSDAYVNCATYLDTLKPIYENSAGKIFRVE